ncbi:MAG: Holliday junction resolvase [Methanobacteriota archaeon]
MGSVFERELKGILGADEGALRRIVRSVPPLAGENYHKIRPSPFLVVRAAGSLGVDLVAVRGDVSFPIEVKASADDVVRFSRNERIRQQADSMRETCSRAGVIPLYAFRRKGLHPGADPWSVFALDLGDRGPCRGMARVVYGLLPKADRTREGNEVLRFAGGMPLNRFIDRLHFLRAAETAGPPPESLLLKPTLS